MATKACSDDSIQLSNDDKYPALILDALIILVNTSTEHFLDKLPGEVLTQNLLRFREAYKTFQGSQIADSCTWYNKSLQSTKYELASFIFRISVNQSPIRNLGLNDVIRSIFGTESEFVKFSLTQWEESPILLKNTGVIYNRDSIFDSLINSFDSKTTETMIHSIFRQLVSCPPIVSDELDIFSFLNEEMNVLGSPIVYGQDIRVLKTLKHDREMHFVSDNMIEAYNNGHTLALRGMEFRSDNIAAISNVLSILFGQPSVGANLYMTPPKSQGLAKHYDDHCVFVWQLFGKKRWRVSSTSATILPRLYESTADVYDGLCEDIQYLLNEGDILYIPRGFLHEACTIIDENDFDGAANFSLHLTFGIEVEAPFEWEGFTHIALHCWNEKRKRTIINNTDSKSRIQNSIFIIILHIAIRLVANDNPTLRKACMVAAYPLSADTHMSKHKGMFQYIIDEINANANFIEAFKCINKYTEVENDNSLQWLRWLRHLHQEGYDDEKIDFSNISEIFKDLVTLFNNHTEEAIMEFSNMKSIFCREASFEDAYTCFLILLEKYRKVRRQYMNGMLSLHSR